MVVYEDGNKLKIWLSNRKLGLVKRITNTGPVHILFN